MNSIDCTISLKDENGATITSSDILDFVTKNAELSSIIYDNPIQLTRTYNNGKLSSETLGTKCNISNYCFSGVYFILSKNNELLYIGKDQNVNGRLNEHLITCSVSTYSKLNKVHSYLLELQKTGQPLELKYFAIASSKGNNGSIEGNLIEHAMNNKSIYPLLWNKRRD